MLKLLIVGMSKMSHFYKYSHIWVFILGSYFLQEKTMY